ncbi:MAG: DUF928 domain-containing protein [Gloeomargarita sp. SKYBB_i_bin120]|nr:DUF928 domain-containing protein [Gloeomargarita sp. SKYG98]MCS7291870.1 DUF928 domain-containing protein [Gloeomargarita sp. SKYB120]MDW8177430.1 DUF928 domain-containing protein [Gloeomargarita sp. SKYBB_i_bin120]
MRRGIWTAGTFLLGASLAVAQTLYTVQLGDTLTGIARRYNLTLEQMLQANPELRRDPDLILVGQQLVIPLSPVERALRTPLPPSFQPRLAMGRRRPAFVSLNLPAVGRPGQREGASKRGSGCTQDKNQRVRLLVPETNYGRTLRDYPTFFWYLPELERPTPVEFQLRLVTPQGQVGEVLYATTFTATGGGIGGLTLPLEAPALQVGQEYEWSLAVQCTADQPDSWMVVMGRIERVAPANRELAAALGQANLGDYPALLAEAGLWYDALQTLVVLRRQYPNEPGLVEDWRNLLSRIGLGGIANQPLRCVQPNPKGGVALCS